MTTIESEAAVTALGAERREAGSLQAVTEWFTTTDHKRIGRHFVFSAVVAAIAAGVIGVLLGVERVASSEPVFDQVLVPQWFEVFRFALVLAVLAPAGIGLAISAVPLQVGARSIAFARLANGAYFAWLAGVVLALVALFNDGGLGGSDRRLVELYLAAHALILVALVAAAVCVVTTVLTTRAPGMTLMRVPLFTWASLIGALGMVLALPVGIGTLLYLFVDVRYAGGVFGEGAAAWLAWLFSQPFTLLLALPAVGVLAELVPVTFRTRQPLRPVVMAGLALTGTAAFAGVAQQSLVTVSLSGSGSADAQTQGAVSLVLFRVLPLVGLLLVFLGLLLAAKPARNADGSRRLPRIGGAFLFAFFGYGMVLVGAIATVLLAIDDLDAVGTVFEEGALVYVAYGGLLGVLGGVVWWLPKFTGRRLPEPPVMGLALLGVLATVLASLPYLIAGLAGQPAAASTFTYSGPVTLWNTLVLIGHGAMVAVVLAMAGLIARAFSGAGEPAGDDPWDAQTIEWTTTSPAPPNNYPEVPRINSAEPLLDLKPMSTVGSPS